MTIDKSLKVKKGVSRSRNVLTRVERIEKMKEMDKWQEGESPFGLPKTRVYRVVLKKKKKAVKADDAAADAKAPAKK
ncbi:MAG: small basic protein [Thermoguttaceae bacterium]|nr:small basic protein [Thermoguttaceae bacterium]MBR5415494.1 small basic protein [Thermoguttaceae bacterium]MBR6480889.1 small basic protein [Thermoguttaceae bacterium]MCR5359705.1 small basic protein [Thermoguttaceae bacterium]